MRILLYILISLLCACKVCNIQEAGQLQTKNFIVTNSLEENQLLFVLPENSKIGATHQEEAVHDYFFHSKGDFSLLGMMSDGNAIFLHSSTVTPSFYKIMPPQTSFCFSVKGSAYGIERFDTRIVLVPFSAVPEQLLKAPDFANFSFPQDSISASAY